MSAHRNDTGTSDYFPARICYVLMSFPAYSETFIAEEAAAMIELGVDVSIVALNSGGNDVTHANARELLSQGRVSVVRRYTKPEIALALLAFFFHMPVRTVSTLASALRADDRWRYLQALPVAWRVRSRRVQYLHAHFADKNLKFAATVSAWTGIPFGFTAHGYDIREPPIERKEFLSLVDLAAAVVTVSTNFKRRMLDKFPIDSEKIFVSHNGVRIERFVPVDEPTDAPALRLIAVGRLVKIKGHDILLAALEQVRHRGDQVQLKLVGDGAARKDLEATVNRLRLCDCVEFLGFCSQDTLIHHFKQSDVLVMPSRDESFGVACVEAMAMGLPVIASRVGGLPEIVVDRQTGLLVEPESPRELANAIICLLDDRIMRQEMGNKGREVAVAKFSELAAAARLLRYFSQSIEAFRSK